MYRGLCKKRKFLEGYFWKFLLPHRGRLLEPLQISYMQMMSKPTATGFWFVKKFNVFETAWHTSWGTETGEVVDQCSQCNGVSPSLKIWCLPVFIHGMGSYARGSSLAGEHRGGSCCLCVTMEALGKGGHAGLPHGQVLFLWMLNPGFVFNWAQGNRQKYYLLSLTISKEILCLLHKR